MEVDFNGVGDDFVRFALERGAVRDRDFKGYGRAERAVDIVDRPAAIGNAAPGRLQPMQAGVEIQGWSCGDGVLHP